MCIRDRSNNYGWDNSITQDQKGYLWFTGITKGVHRYDGKKLTTYSHNPDNSNSLASNIAIDLSAEMCIRDRERRYRGYCIKDLSVFNPVLAEFNRVKADIYKLFTDCKFLDEKYIKSTLRYLDEFYATINNTKAWQKAFAYPLSLIHI